MNLWLLLRGSVLVASFMFLISSVEEAFAVGFLSVLVEFANVSRVLRCEISGCVVAMLENCVPKLR